MLIFNLTIHPLWGRVPFKYPQTRTLACVDQDQIECQKFGVFYNHLKLIVGQAPRLYNLPSKS
jgi:hypothetical protein